MVDRRGKLLWLASYPKSGNTWLRLFIQDYLFGEGQPVALDKLSIGTSATARGWLDESLGIPTADLDPAEVDRLRPLAFIWESERSEALAPVKVHETYHSPHTGKPLFPAEATAAAIYLVRNPLDVAVSFAHHQGISIDAAIDFMADENAALGRKGKAGLTPQLPQFLSSWSGNVRSWTEAGLAPLVLRYEDMVTRPQEAFGRVAALIDPCATPEKVDASIANTSFDRLQAQEAESGFREKPVTAQRFFRSGKIGQWRSALNREQVRRTIERHGETMFRFGYSSASGLEQDM